MSKQEMQGLKEGGVIKQNHTEDGEVETPSFMDRLVKLKGVLKLGRHHKMERFTILLSATVILLLFFTGIAFANHRTDLSNFRSSQTVFTDSFTFSLSNQKGTVEGVYGDEDKTDVIVLLKFRSPGDMSANAENYEVFVTGEKRSLRYDPEVSFALFGSTGYGIVRFQHEDGLRSEILEVTLRANTTLTASGVSGSDEDDDNTDGDEDRSFSWFDQARFYVNVGADLVEDVGITPNESDPRKLYMGLVADEQDKDIHTRIAETTQELQALLNREREYMDRLETTGYITPERPWFIDGDTVDDEGVFRPATLLSKAHDFDYWSGTIRDGYLEQVVQDVSDFGDYMEERTGRATDIEEARENERSERIERATHVTTVDGSRIDLSTIVTGRSSAADVGAKDAVETLQTVWRNYLTEKGRLQRTILSELLVLDADVQSLPQVYSEHRGDSAYTIY